MLHIRLKQGLSVFCYYHLPTLNSPTSGGLDLICSAWISANKLSDGKSSISRSIHPVDAHFLGARNICRPLMVESLKMRRSSCPPSSGKASWTPDASTLSQASLGRMLVRTYLCVWSAGTPCPWWRCEYSPRRDHVHSAAVEVRGTPQRTHRATQTELRSLVLRGTRTIKVRCA